jgi:transcriptional regulator with XRE-family HTH domain
MPAKTTSKPKTDRPRGSSRPANPPPEPAARRPTVDGLGPKIRARREALGLSLRAFGAQAGLSASFLAQIEREEADPSLETLQNIARLLRVPMLYFFSDERSQQRVVLPETRRRLNFPGSNVTYELLLPGLNHRAMGLTIRVGPGVVIHPIGLSEPTEEWLLVLQGSVEIDINGVVYQLQAGASICYEGWEFRGLTSLGPEDAVLVGGMTPPAF